MRAVIGEIERVEGRIDYLITAAAVFVSRPFLEFSQEEWARTLAVNTTGTWLASRLVLEGMLRRQFGRIVLLSSMLARTGGVNCAAYAASKGGVLGLARALALEVAADGIRVNTVSPGLTDTPQPRGHLSEEQLAAKARALPLGRIATVEEVVEGVLFLLSDESSYYTGQDLRIAGGHGLF
jgi:NAD(P)-dependent dehydrogenase (short-subunit alcohol dehydrogenase family)